MRYQTQNLQDTSIVQLKYGIDRVIEKTILTVYEDSSNEAFLNMMQEFQNCIKTYKIWNDENDPCTVYRNF